MREFCKQQSDQLYAAGTRRRRSILLQIKDDIDYNLGLYRSFKALGLSKKQHTQIDALLAPLFVVPLLYCSAVDLMARVKHKGTVQGQNGRIFRDSAQSFFGLSDMEASKLWSFRNSLSYQYSIRNFILSRTGTEKVIEVTSNDVIVSVRPMRASLVRATGCLFEYLSAEGEADKGRTSGFLKKHGFTYYLVA